MEAKSSAATPVVASTPLVDDVDDDQARGGFKRPRYTIHSDSE